MPVSPIGRTQTLEQDDFPMAQPAQVQEEGAAPAPVPPSDSIIIDDLDEEEQDDDEVQLDLTDTSHMRLWLQILTGQTTDDDIEILDTLPSMRP